MHSNGRLHILYYLIIVLKITVCTLLLKFILYLVVAKFKSVLYLNFPIKKHIETLY